MDQKIMEEIFENCKWYEKIIVIIFKKIILKIYKRGIKKGFNFAN